MSDSNSSSTNDSLPHQLPSSNSSLYVYPCTDFTFLHTTKSFTSIVILLPLSVFVLYLGFQRWKQQRATAAIISHSDFFTYNMAAMELIGVLGYTITICGTYTKHQAKEIMNMGIYIEVYRWFGQMVFPILTCVDRYLAVVHPITYLRLRQGGGVFIRNISTAYIWLQGFAGPGFLIWVQKYPQYIYIPSVFQLVLFLFIMLFCSLSVLCVLIRPRPGELGGERVRIHRSKQRAFRTIMIIMGVLLLKFGGNLVCNVLDSTSKVSEGVKCWVIIVREWLNMPSSLTLSLLFLHRAGKLTGCKNKAESG